MTHVYAPPIYEDETIYSYVARLHIYWAETSHRRTANRWFGKSPINISQSLPIGVNYLAEATGYSTEKLLTHHTLYPLFAGFCTRPDKLKSTMLSSSGRDVANVSNIAQAGLRELGSSKYCPECLEQDKAIYGIAFWHLSHQMHGITCCPVHSICLRNIEYSHREFHLPPQVDVCPRQIASTHAVRLTYLISRFQFDYLYGQTDCLEEYEWEPMNLLHVKHQFKGHNVDMSLLMKTVSELSQVLFSSQILTQNVVHNLLHKPAYVCHPLKFIFLSYAIDQLPTKPIQAAVAQSKNVELHEQARLQCIRLLKTQKYSLREVARRVNRSVVFVKTIASQAQIPFEKRTQFITFDITARIEAAAREGASRRVLAAQEGISVAAVEQIIQSVKGLSEYRRKLRKSQRQESARLALQRAIQNNPSVPEMN
ncbi:TniQ family protein [Alishewanella sp. HL-SH05]|uniref:TniQ family protein n=1 Tax=Alishewanella sp. HL-SH05 TaxID=3461145 RepID=UPI00404120D8